MQLPEGLGSVSASSGAATRRFVCAHGRYHRENPDEERYREALEAENDKLEEDLRKERRTRWESKEEQEEDRGPSRGPAWMYVADGTLVWAPRGKSCGGAAANAAPATPRPPRVNTSSTGNPPAHA